MTWTILGLTALIIVILTILKFGIEFQKSWPIVYVNEEEALKDLEADITSYAYRADQIAKRRANNIQDKELGKLLMLGKTHTAKLAKGKS